MPDDPRNRPGPPPARRRRSSRSSPAPGLRSGNGGPPRRDPRNRPGDEHPVTPRPTRDVLIIPVTRLPAGAAPVDLVALLQRLRVGRAAAARPIGGEAAPEAIAATLTDAEITALVQEFDGRATVVSDTPIEL